MIFDFSSIKMFIEVIYNSSGIITDAISSDTPPEKADSPMMSKGSRPAGYGQCRIYFDILSWMDFKENTGRKAVLVDGEPEIVDIPGVSYLRDNFTVDMRVAGKVNTGTVRMPKDPNDKTGATRMEMKKLRAKP